MAMAMAAHGNNILIDLSTCSSSGEEDDSHIQQGPPFLARMSSLSSSRRGQRQHHNHNRNGAGTAAAATSTRRTEPPIEISSSPSLSPTATRTKTKMSSSEKQQSRARARRWAEENRTLAKATTRPRRKAAENNNSPAMADRKMSSNENKEARARARRWVEQSLPNVAAAAAASSSGGGRLKTEGEEDDEDDDISIPDDPMSESSISSAELPRTHPRQQSLFATSGSTPSEVGDLERESQHPPSSSDDMMHPRRQHNISRFNGFEENVMSESPPSPSSFHNAIPRRHHANNSRSTGTERDVLSDSSPSPFPFGRYRTADSSHDVAHSALSGGAHQRHSNHNAAATQLRRQMADGMMWDCPRCTLNNQHHHVECDACQHINPRLISNGSAAQIQQLQQLSFDASSLLGSGGGGGNGGWGRDRTSRISATTVSRNGYNHHQSSSTTAAALGHQYRAATRFPQAFHSADDNSSMMSYERLLEMFGDGGENRGATSSTISSLPSIKLDDPERQLPEDKRQCNICLEDFCPGDDRTSLPCLHGYHSGCINRWLSSNGSCPVCKTSVSD